MRSSFLFSITARCIPAKTFLRRLRTGRPQSGKAFDSK